MDEQARPISKYIVEEVIRRPDVDVHTSTPLVSSRLIDPLALVKVLHKVVNCYKAIAILMLNAVVLYAGLDLAARSSFKITSLISSPAQEPLVGEGNPREKVSYYSSQDWAEQYWYEHRLSSTQRYYPYVGWRRDHFKGKTIEIDENGVRATPGADCSSANSFKVFAFGGSTLWGTGSPDWGTIPAYLQAVLQKLRNGPVCVVNFGESGYVSTQGVIALLMQLKSGNVPNLVVFYDGPPDIYAAYQSGRAGVHQNFDAIAARFESRQNPPPPPTLVDWLRSTHSYSLIENMINKLTIVKPEQGEPTAKLVTYETMGIDVATLSGLIVQGYFTNYKIVSALAQKYGFKSFFFLQPIVSMGSKPLTGEEQEIKDGLKMNHGLNKLYTSVYQAIELESPKYQNVHSMAHIFDGYNSLLWIDELHVTPLGNQLIAQKMLDIIKARSS
jgi:lysophospholipase L1-like esterase